MDKVYTYAQLTQLFQLSEHLQGLSEAERIDRAGQGISLALQRLPQIDPQFVYVFAGAEDNGAYALASARHLQDLGLEVCVYLFYRSGRLSSAVQAELALCEQADVCVYKVQSAFEGIGVLQDGACLLDGLLGRELSEPLEGAYRSLVSYMNGLHLPIVSIDLPSGLVEGFEDEGQEYCVIHARHTIAIEAFSPAHLLRENLPYLGRCECLSLGIDSELYERVDSPLHLISDSLLVDVLGQGNPVTKPTDMGQVLIVGGSPGRYGHLLLSARSARAVGVGQVCLHTLAEACIPLQMTEPEFVCTSAGTDAFHKYPKTEACSALALGVALEASTLGTSYILELVKQKKCPMVCAGPVAEQMVKTPYMAQELHPETLLVLTQADQQRMYGPQTTESECMWQALQQAKYCQRPILLLGYYPRLCCPSGSVYISAQGYSVLMHPALEQMQIASIAGLLACGYDAILSSVLACYLYAEAANLCALSFEQSGYSSAEILSKLPSVLNGLYGLR